MKRIFSIAAALLVSGAAVAQPAPPPPGDWNPGSFWRGAPDNPWQRIQFLQDRIDRGRRDGSLDPREADRAQGELQNVKAWIDQMHWRDRAPLGPDQRARLQQRLDNVSRQIRWMRHDGW